MPLNVWILFAAQALALCTTPLMVFAGALATRSFAPSPAYATLPVAAIVVGTALSVFPAALLCQRFGRKAVFLGAMVLGAGASLLALQAMTLHSFWGFVGASLILGVVVAVTQQFRFAAMESVTQERMPLAASRLLAAGLISAVLGPELVMLGEQVYGELFTGAFLLLAGLFVVAFVILAFGFKNPQMHSAPQQGNQQERKRDLLTHSGFLVAAMSAGIGYGVMSFIMTATPISMHEMQAFSLVDTKLVIQSHILAMFIPSLFAGRLIIMFGHTRLIVLGLVAYAICVVLGVLDHSWLHYWWALVLLGIGWNFLFVAGTSLLPKMYRPEQAHRAQGINDAVVFSTQALGALSSSAVLYWLGWNGLLLLTLPLLVFMAVILYRWLRAGQPAAMPMQPEPVSEPDGRPASD
ncbi:MFS transporter [Parendozoicomonas haliclonae]|uniref:Major Facilitator Superfamily protein n=1 Tax=Parendozoicomonas haliclonae TaxID=1960125 RepID=A0A1X7AMT5_9GAMM|nr:MFS transporter [Parendozoicomonas haliclonae]SMA49341.1 Major Facilitator Superfamily protein [Parendozoicomonas haliclonae]